MNRHQPVNVLVHNVEPCNVDYASKEQNWVQTSHEGGKLVHAEEDRAEPKGRLYHPHPNAPMDWLPPDRVQGQGPLENHSHILLDFQAHQRPHRKEDPFAGRFFVPQSDLATKLGLNVEEKEIGDRYLSSLDDMQRHLDSFEEPQEIRVALQSSIARGRPRAQSLFFHSNAGLSPMECHRCCRPHETSEDYFERVLAQIVVCLEIARSEKIPLGHVTWSSKNANSPIDFYVFAVIGFDLIPFELTLERFPCTALARHATIFWSDIATRHDVNLLSANIMCNHYRNVQVMLDEDCCSSSTFMKSYADNRLRKVIKEQKLPEVKATELQAALYANTNLIWIPPDVPVKDLETWRRTCCAAKDFPKMRRG